MNAKTFVDSNSDVIIKRLTDADFEKLSAGCVVFGVAVSRGIARSENRHVLNAGYWLVANTSQDSHGNTNTITVMCTTKGGTVKVDWINKTDTDDMGTRLLYHCKPLPVGDIRTGGNWNYK